MALAPPGQPWSESQASAPMFAGFTASDFDAYAREKWRSNTFNRERLEVKEKLAALGRAVAGALVVSDDAPLLCEASAEHPALWNHKQVDAQHLFFSRHTEARKQLDKIIERQRSMASMLDDPSPQRSHIFLTVSITQSHLFAGLKLHRDASVDRRNLEAIVADGRGAGELRELGRRLPSEFRVGVSDGARLEPSQLDAAAITGLVRELCKPLEPRTSRWFVAGRDIDRQSVVDAGPSIADEVRAILLAVAPLYRFIAWTRGNDRISMRDELRDQQVARRVRGLEKHDKVRITSGMFTGRTGVVQDVDAKGGIKVLVGKVPIKLSAADVEKQ